MPTIVNQALCNLEVLYYTSYKDYLAHTATEELEPFLVYVLDKQPHDQDFTSKAHDLILAIMDFYTKLGEAKSGKGQLKRAINWFTLQESEITQQINQLEQNQSSKNAFPLNINLKNSLLTRKQNYQQAIHALEEVQIERN